MRLSWDILYKEWRIMSVYKAIILNQILALWFKFRKNISQGPINTMASFGLHKE